MKNLCFGKRKSSGIKIELAADGYERIDAVVQEIENLAYEGIFSDKDAVSRFQQIASEVKKMRRVLREVLLLVPTHDTALPAATIRDGGGDAA
jgi:hypothetical protein